MGEPQVKGEWVLRAPLLLLWAVSLCPPQTASSRKRRGSLNSSPPPAETPGHLSPRDFPSNTYTADVTLLTPSRWVSSA